MRIIAWDTETGLIRPALLAPPLVCVTWKELGSDAAIIHHSDAEPLIRGWLEDADIQLVGHNVAYDMAVVCERFPALRPLVFDAYKTNRVTDTMLRQQLLDIAAGEYRGRLGSKGQWIEHKYDLETLARRCAGIVLQKDGWRLSYGEFINTPLTEWPTRARQVQAAARPRIEDLSRQIADATEAKDVDRAKALTKERDGLVAMVEGDPTRASEYPLDDARATLAVYCAQEKHAAYLHDQYRQAYAAFALHLSSAWGLRTDADGVEILRRETQAECDELEASLIEAGLIRNDKKRTRDTKAAKARMIRVCLEEALPLRRTEAHTDPECTKCRDTEGNPLPAGDDACAEHVCLDADACTVTDDEILKEYAAVSTAKKVLSNDVEALKKGIRYPVHTRYGMAETGRTTSSKPNIQNVGKRAGIRECFVARPGHVFFAADFPALEMYTWAQCCKTWLGTSKLADALNAGLDPHLAVAATILGLPYEQANARLDDGDPEVADIRQLTKPGNFGWPGGMGPPKMLLTIKKQLKPELVERLGLDLERVKRLKEEWFGTWPEARAYFERIKSLGPPYPEEYRATVESLFTKRFRGGATYCAACNTGFQALGVDCAKAALCGVAHEQYVDLGTPLFNTRTVAFVHDEIIGEAREEVAAEAAERLGDVMVAEANRFLPDVPIKRSKIKPLLMRRWSKKAKSVVDSNGRLVPWAA